jgi:hypothetical protein
LTGLADTFMRIMSDQPLSLALVVVVLLLLYMMNKQFNAFSKARSEASAMIVTWQKETQQIMADAVSKEVMQMVLNALERDRETYRAMLPTFQDAPEKPPQTSDEP